MRKVMALHYILYRGVKVVSSIPNPTSPNINPRSLNAQIGTKLFQCLFAAEKRECTRNLQRPIFKASG
jgi:hypothetical protein